MVPEMNLIDQGEKARLDDLAERKKRGKGPPKKGMHASFGPLIQDYRTFQAHALFYSDLASIN